MSALIVAIDGPSGVGKTTVSKRVARRLSVPQIDTGAMYRAIAVAALRQNVPTSDAERLASIAESSRIDFRGAADDAKVFLNDEDVSSEIRTPEISMMASTISAIPAVRRTLVRLQQELGMRSGGVLEGRDIGTKVFPSTPHKFFLTAIPDERARRRHLELQVKGVTQPLDSVLEEMNRRDQQDSGRADSPLTWDDTYEVIDTSALTIDEVVERIVGHVTAKVQANS